MKYKLAVIFYFILIYSCDIFEKDSNKLKVEVANISSQEITDLKISLSNNLCSSDVINVPLNSKSNLVVDLEEIDSIDAEYIITYTTNEIKKRVATGYFFSSSSIEEKVGITFTDNGIVYEELK